MGRPFNTHLTTDEFVRLVTDDLTAEAARGIDRHLAGCARCAAEVGRFYGGAEFPKARWDAMRSETVSRLRRAIFGRP